MRVTTDAYSDRCSWQTTRDHQIPQRAGTDETCLVSRKPAKRPVDGRSPALAPLAVCCGQRSRHSQDLLRIALADQRADWPARDRAAGTGNGGDGYDHIERGARLPHQDANHPSVAAVSTTSPSTDRSARSSRT